MAIPGARGADTKNGHRGTSIPPPASGDLPKTRLRSESVTERRNRSWAGHADPRLLSARRWPLTSLLCSLIKCFRGPCPVLGPRDARPGDSPAHGPLLVLWETKHGQDSREVQGQGHVRALWERSGGAPESGRIGAAAHLLENEAAALSGI